MAPSRSRARGEVLIPLKADGLKPTDLDWMTGDLTFIASDRSWADRISKVLKELQAAKAPELCANSSQHAAKTFPPEGLRCFSQTRPLTDQESADLHRHWLLWRVDPKTVLSFSAPPAGSWNDAFKQEQDPGAIFERVKRESVKMGSLRPGHGETAGHQSLVIPSGLRQDDKITLDQYLAIIQRIRQDLINRFGLEMADAILELLHKQKPEPGQTLIQATPARKASLIKPH